MNRKFNFIPAICLITLIITSNTSAQDITPQKDSVLYSFQVADMYFEMDESFGGRISSLKLGDKEVMFVNRDYSDPILWGSTVWPAPQNVWGWPPSTTLDSDPYSGMISGNYVIMTSDVDDDSNLRFKKTFYASGEDTSVTIVYTFINEGLDTENDAVWEVTRVPPGGVSFFPAGEGSVTGNLAVYVETVNNVSWYEYENSHQGGRKFYSDGSKGWFAHASDDSILFIKQFKDVHHDSVAPDENEIELWLNGDHAYIELENQSKYYSIPPGDSIEYEVKWYLRQIPEDIDISTGSMELVDYVSDVTETEPVISTDLPGYKSLSHNIYVITNPYTGYTAFKNLPAGTFTVKLNDLAGKTLRTSTITTGNNYLHTGDLKRGLYIYVISNELITVSGKLLVE
ncbi:MAG: T9SS type A sorting domain-containing protein [Bacteroidales bacterium]|nr:MAG: T9SS type A sorting domain-containing protein [Bacteroidales bacterium]